MPAPFKALELAPAKVDVTCRSGGTMLLRSPHALGAYPRCTTDKLLHWAAATPKAPFIAEREGAQWRKLTYAQTADHMRALGQALIDAELGADKPLLILSGNSVDAALLSLAAQHVGVPVAPVSVAYSLQSTDHLKLRHLVEMLKPGLVFADDPAPFEPAIADAGLVDTPLITSASLCQLQTTAPSAQVQAANAAIDGDTVAKILFTSGSTGMPKGVLNTQRMLCSNQRAIEVMWPFLKRRPPVLVDWLPWSHTFGSNHNFNMVLWHGGTLYIDGGKPAPDLVQTSLANLRDVSPTLYFNVPRGYDVLLPHLEADEALCSRFFAELDVIFYAAAALPPNLWHRLEALSERTLGRRVVMLSAWGSTETAPLATSVHYPIEAAGVIGLPAPGTELKMVPNHGKLELRVRGPNVTPGYLGDETLTAEAFDDEGFFCMGDAGKLADPDDPAKGIVFDGRTAESFKLTSGTWVHVGSLRTTLIAAGAPVIADCVLTGHDQPFIGLIIFANPDGCRTLAPNVEALVDQIADDRVIAAVHAGLLAHNAANPQSSRAVRRAIITAEPPSIDDNEITDKGYINQRAVLERRADLVRRLHAGAPDDTIIVVG